MSSVRFICGTQDIHKELEKKRLPFLRNRRYYFIRAAFDANGGVFEPLLGEEDCIISDSLNHALLLMVFVCVKQLVTVTKIITWKT